MERDRSKGPDFYVDEDNNVLKVETTWNGVDEVCSLPLGNKMDLNTRTGSSYNQSLATPRPTAATPDEIRYLRCFLLAASSWMVLGM